MCSKAKKNVYGKHFWIGLPVFFNRTIKKLKTEKYIVNASLKSEIKSKFASMYIIDFRSKFCDYATENVP